jgi:DNA-binding transcriptional LysR family regulator
MDVNHLRSFLALAETGNLTRAAERLNYAPSSVSAHLRAIETELGIELTERSGRGIALTAAARDFMPHARTIVNAVSAAVVNVQANRRSVLTICAIPSIAAYGLPAIAGDLAALGIQLSLRTVTNCVDVLRGLVDGEHDLTLTLHESALLDRFSERLDYEVLGDVRIVVAVAPAHRLTRESAVDLLALDGESLIVTEPGCKYRASFEALLDASGVRQGELFTLEDFTTIRALARGGAGVAIVPRFVIEADLDAGMLVELPITVPERFVMLAAWRHEPLTEPLQRVLDVVRAGARRMTGRESAAHVSYDVARGRTSREVNV